MDNAQHDELARLFAQNMHLQQHHQQQQQQQQQWADAGGQYRQQDHASFAQRPTESTHIEEKGPIHFISSHYTPTAHIRPESTASSSPPPPYHEVARDISLQDIENTLRQHSIDPSSLLPAQIDLFASAQHDQRLRLLELWRISPPVYPLETHLHYSSHTQTPQTGSWTTANIAREALDARARYEESRLSGRQVIRWPREEHMLDTTCNAPMDQEQPISPIREPGEAAWPPAARMRAASIAAASGRGNNMQAYSHAEPYIVDGYKQQQQSPAQSVDPVYTAAAGLWQAPSYAHAVQQQQQHEMVEDQYGMYEQIRNHSDWERMNERVAREKMAQLHQQHRDSVMDDEDMEL